MSNLFASFVIAFSMYSTLPMPRIDWQEKNMRYAMCFFPWVGAAVGGGVFLWTLLASRLELGSTLYGALAAALPLLITGGIHMDGYCDTVDAISSHQSRERKLEILKDSHVGAFALIGVGVYLLLSLGLWSEFSRDSGTAAILAAGFVLSRCFSGISVITFPNARGSGTVATFAEMAAKKRVRLVLCVYVVAVSLWAIWQSPVFGGVTVLAAFLTFGWYWYFSKKEFGGITGDLCGFFLQLCELFMLGAVVLTERVIACF